MKTIVLVGLAAIGGNAMYDIMIDQLGPEKGISACIGALMAVIVLSMLWAENEIETLNQEIKMLKEKK